MALLRLLRRPDFQSNPIRALWRRVFWRVRWRLTARPWIHSIGKGLTLATPKLGTGAMIYYRGRSEPETAKFFERFLRPGMVVIDVGAHFGEYTLLAAGAVGREGRVHAFEPDPDLFGLLCENVERNDLHNVELTRSAVAEAAGDREFEVRKESAVSSLRPPQGPGDPDEEDWIRIIKVPTTTLDQYWGPRGGRLDLVKIDVEGAELRVFEGAAGILSRPRSEAPVWIFEHSRENCPRFGYAPEQIVSLLRQQGYTLMSCTGAGEVEVFDGAEPAPTFNLIATKDPEGLKSSMPAGAAGRRSSSP